MLCRISKENSKLIDKITTNYNSKNILISIAEEISLFFKLENNVLYTKIKILSDFFDKLCISNHRNISIPYTNFYFPEMEYLEIEVTEYEIVFYWLFSTHKRIKSFCLIEKEPYKIEFEMSKSFKLDSFLLLEVLKHLPSNEINISFADMISFYGTEHQLNSLVKLENKSEFYDFNLSVLKKSLKCSLNDFIVNCDFFIDENNSKMCVSFENDLMVFTHLMPIYLDKSKNSLV